MTESSKIIDSFVLYGVLGDLSVRKLIPAWYYLERDSMLSGSLQILGVGRKKISDSELKNTLKKSLETYVPTEYLDQTIVSTLIDRFSYCSCDLQSPDSYQKLKLKVQDWNMPMAHYLAISPGLFESVCDGLSGAGLVTKECRIIVEKPVGYDLESSQEINEKLIKHFDESQIYRIDHYLGKETVQNLMALRFANVLLEPLWNNNYIDHVQITVAETGDVNGRGEYYDDVGAMRDMVQNHLLQLLCLIAMEPPAHFDADDIRNEKLKVIRAIQPVDLKDTVRGQYVNGDNSFKFHVNNTNSKTESFVALKAHISNWRWAGVPFYLRTGKAMSKKVSEIVIEFKPLAHSIFPDLGENYQNKLVIRLQPEEGMTLHIGVKEPGPGGMRLINAPLDMTFAQLAGQVDAIEAYERLIMDTCRGDQTLFMRGDELEAAWSWVDKIILDWNKSEIGPIEYNIGCNGPAEAEELLTQDGRSWQ